MVSADAVATREGDVGEVGRLLFFLDDIGVQVRRALRAQSKKLSLTTSEMRTLAALAAGASPATYQQIQQTTRYNETTINLSINALARRGLVKKGWSRSASRTIVSISCAGRTAVSQLGVPDGLAAILARLQEVRQLVPIGGASNRPGCS